MSRLFGFLKVVLVLALDFLCIYNMLQDAKIALLIVAGITLYVFFGGYIALLREGAVKSKKLPAYQKSRLDAVKARLVNDVKSACGADISSLKLYLVPGDDEMNASAYGCRCVSVTQGTFNTADPITLTAVLGHECSHILHFDAEFNRAVFCTVMILVSALGIMSFATVAIIFLIFLLLSCFRSWLGFMAFRGITKIVRAIFCFFQRGVVVVYQLLLGIISRHSEYRSDRFSCQLGYGIQLAHFLALSEPSNQRQLTLSEAMNRTHPPKPKRIARIEAYVHRT